MKTFRTIAVGVLCLAVLCGAAILWRAHKQKATEQKKLTYKASAYRARAEKGDAAAQYALAYMYFQGRGMPQDNAKAVHWARMAADQGYAKAQAWIGSSYFYGVGVAQDYPEAARWYRKAADQGDAVAQYDLGSVYYHGNGVSQDYTEAARWYRKAADQGDAGAQYALAYMYYHGQAVGQDYAQAANWFHQAADRGDAQAQYQLGYMYYQGKGVPRDQVKAVRWFRKAAEQGNVQAQRALRVSISVPTKIFIGIDFLGILFLSVAAYREARKGLGPLQRAAIIRELLATINLVLVFMRLFHLAVAYTTVFRLSMHFLAGVIVAMLVPILRPKSEKFVLKLSITLFLVFNLFATARFNLTYAAALTYLFYPVNGFLIGMAIPSAAALWFAARKEEHDLNSQLRPHSMQSR